MNTIHATHKLQVQAHHSVEAVPATSPVQKCQPGDVVWLLHPPPLAPRALEVVLHSDHATLALDVTDIT